MADVSVSPGDDIQTKINNATAGDRLIFDPGTYNVTTGFLVNKNLELVGAGSSDNPAVDTIITHNGTTSNRIRLSHTGSNWTTDVTKISGMRVIGTGTNIRAIDTLDGFAYGDISDCVFIMNGTGYVFEISNNGVADHIKLDNVILDGTDPDISGANACIRASSLTTIDDITISNCTFKNAVDGIQTLTNGTAESTVTNMTVTNCAFTDIGRRGIVCDDLSDFLMDGCTFEHCGYDTSKSDIFGIKITLKYREDYKNINISNLTMNNCGIASSDGEGTAINISARIEGGYASNSAKVDGVSIDGTISNSGEMAVLLLGETKDGDTVPSPTYENMLNVSIDGLRIIDCPATDGVLDNRHAPSTKLDARNVYWNDAAGPGISSGTGDTVSGYFTDPVTDETANKGGISIATWLADNKTNETVLFDPWVPQIPEYNYRNAERVEGLTIDTIAGVQRNGNVASESPQTAVGHKPKLGPTVIWHRSGGYTPSQAAQGMGGGRNASGQIGHKYGN